MRTSYSSEDVQFLLKDVTELVEPSGEEERERLHQQGSNYGMRIPIETEPSKEYLELYDRYLEDNAETVAELVNILSSKIITEKGRNIVLVSLARAGTPIGILLKRCLEKLYEANVKHYTLSIIIGVGLDQNAMNYILARHRPSEIQFVDGWTGKGTIYRELKSELRKYPSISNELAVLSDPAKLLKLHGTTDDILIPNAILNSIVSGLVSRTFYREDIIKGIDFHGALYYEELKYLDKSNQFIDTIEKYFTQPHGISGIDEIKSIQREFQINDIKLIKPSLGEATRVLLRRIPWKILVRNLTDPSVKHIIRLAKEKNVEVVEYPLVNYRACGLIKNVKYPTNS